MKHLDLFSGIGGFALAADWVWPGIEHIFCDNEPFCQKVLKKHWPDAQIYGDIRTLTNAKSCGRDSSSQQEVDAEAQGRKQGRRFDYGSIYILTGGFPCQPFSQAGRRKGTEDDRYLWGEMARVIREFKPRWVVAENVAGLLTWNGGVVFETVCADLEAAGYEVQAFVIPACAVGAPHRRDRVWIVAHSVSDREGSAYGEELGKREFGAHEPNERKGSEVRSDVTNGDSNVAHRSGERQQTWTRRNVDNDTNLYSQRNRRQRETVGWKYFKSEGWSRNWLEVATRLCALDDGLPDGLVRPKGWRNAALKAAGNAIVPAVAEQIFIAIKAADETHHALPLPR